jgi:hypothetical protein
MPVRMEALAPVVSIATAVRLLGLTWVGVRVLRVGVKNGAAPETILGLSFLCFSTLGVPLLTLGGYGAALVADASPTLIALALALLDVGALGFAEFIRRVFRADSRAARLAIVLAAASLIAHVLLAWLALSSASGSISPIAALGRIEWVLSIVMFGVFGWGAAEAFTYWGRLRRQRALGLGDPVATQRMLWFAVGCASQIAMMGFTMLASLRGTNPLADPVPALGIAVTSLATGVAFAIALGAKTHAEPSAARVGSAS